MYDDYGRATEITIEGVTETYGYDAQDVRVTVDGVDQLWDRNGLPTLISTGAGDNYVHVDGVARDSNDWLLADAVGSVRATVDQTGVVSAETAFTAFGEPLAGNTDSFGFAGEQLDTTGLLHLRARQYNPSVGRFTSVDPVQPGAPGTTGYNLYSYAGKNPTVWTDPSGEAVLVERALLQVVRAQTFIATSARTQAVLAWLAANPLALCGAGASLGGAAYYFSGNRTYGDAAIGALEGCEAGLSVTELADAIGGFGARPRSNVPGDPEVQVESGGNLGSVTELETGQYQPLANRSRGDGLTPDHIPSHAARRSAAEAQLGRPLTDQEDRALRNVGNCLVVRTCDHQQISRTYGGRNNATQIEADAQNLRAAAEADVAVWREFLVQDGYSPREVDRAIAELHSLNEADGIYDD